MRKKAISGLGNSSQFLHSVTNEVRTTSFSPSAYRKELTFLEAYLDK